jgi:hypothetical protein
VRITVSRFSDHHIFSKNILHDPPGFLIGGSNMGRRQTRRFRPVLDSLEVRQVLSASASNPVVHAAIVPIAVPIGTYNNTFTQIGNAFESYEGTPVDNALNAIGSTVSTLVDPSDSGSENSDYVQGGKDDPVALQGRLITAISKLPGGKAEAGSIVNQAFALGGLTTSDAPYFQSKLTAIVKQNVTQEVHRGTVILVWPGETLPHHRA